MDRLDDFFEIIYQNENFLVINKKNGISTQSNKYYNNSIEDILKKFGKPFSQLPRCGIVHRLDRLTTGLLIIAKNLNYFNFLLSLFKERKIYKEYISLHEGKLDSNKGEISFFLKKSFSPKKKIRMVLDKSQQGKFVKIYFNLISENDNFSLLKVIPITGRTHQIRLAFETINFPIYNDPIYNKNNYLNNELDIGQYLHAYRISFFDKISFNFTARIPDFFEKRINDLSIIFN